MPARAAMALVVAACKLGKLSSTALIRCLAVHQLLLEITDRATIVFRLAIAEAEREPPQ